MADHETFRSRLGFLLTSAGCAIGLGNVWRFPYITGQYGGGAFVLLYLLFLLILALPILVMEFAVGRASRQSVARSFATLQKPGGRWHLFGYVAMAGNYLLMMFYTTIAAWMLSYVYRSAAGDFQSMNPQQIERAFYDMQARPGPMLFWLLVTILLGFFICSFGLRRGVERITKVMMSLLIVILALLCLRSLTLPGASEGVRFYLLPDWDRMRQNGVGHTIYAAMSQAFFTLSIGIGSMAIFGSYLDRSRSLPGEALYVGTLDTLVALMSGLIILPACFAFQVDPQQGPGLVFVTLPNIFNQMPGGRFWGLLFFLFMSFAALSTIVAVFENLLRFAMDLWSWSRKKAVIFHIFAVFLLSLPCALGFNLWSDVILPGIGNIQSIEDFIVSYNLLPLGSLIYLMFCLSRRGWGWDNFLREANAGSGLSFPRWSRPYLRFVLPAIMLVIFLMGYLPLIRRWF